MATENWYYINPGTEKPFRVTFDDDKVQVQIPYKENLKAPGERILFEHFDDESKANIENLPEPIEKAGGKTIEIDSEKVFRKPQEKSICAAIYGYAGFVNKKLTIIPPVVVNKDQTVAYLLVTRSGLGNYPKIDDIVEIIRMNNFMPTITRKELQEDLKKVMEGKTNRILIAKGRATKDGWPEYIETTLRMDKKAGKELEDGRIDFKERGWLREVRKDEQVGIYHPGQKKRDGFDIYGEKKEALDKIVGFRMGENLYRDPENPTIVKSLVNGYFHQHGRTISINETLEIKGDIDYDVGNIEFFGNVEVKGDIKPGFSVTSFGNVVVHGVVDSGSIFASKSLVIHRGYLGKKEGSKIECLGDIEVLYVRNGNVKAGGKIVIKDFVHNSILNSNDEIIAVEKTGQIVGGVTNARRKITVLEAGSEQEVQTRFICGVDQEHENNIRKKKQEILQLMNKREHILTRGKEFFNPLLFRNPKVVLEKLEGKQKIAAVNLLKQYAQVLKTIQLYEKEVQDLEEYGPRFDFEPEIEIKNKKHGGVKLEYAKSRRKRPQEAAENAQAAETPADPAAKNDGSDVKEEPEPEKKQ